MAVTIRVTVEDVTTQLLTYNRIQIERANSVGGTYALVNTITLVSGTYYYSYADTSGDVNKWYRYRFFHATTLAASDYSNPFRPDGLTRLKIRQEVLKVYRAGLTLLMDAVGSTIQISTADFRFKSSTFRADRGKNSYVLVTTGNRVDQARIISATDPTNGTLNVSPAFTGSAFVVNDEFEWHWLVDPETLNNCINSGLNRYWFLERVPIVGVAGQEEYDLATLPWITRKKQITGLWHYELQTTSNTDDGNESPWTGNGRWWGTREDSNSVKLLLYPTIETTKTIWLEALRRVQPVYTDSSILPAVVNQELCTVLAYDEVLAYLMQPGQHGTSEDRKAWERARILLQPRLIRLLKENRPKPKYNPPGSLTPANVPVPYRAR